MNNIIDLISITPAAAKRWGRTVASNLHRVRGIGPDRIPAEAARDNGDGTVTIYVALPGDEEISMVLQSGEWTWVN